MNDKSQILAEVRSEMEAELLANLSLLSRFSWAVRGAGIVYTFFLLYVLAIYPFPFSLVVPLVFPILAYFTFKPFVQNLKHRNQEIIEFLKKEPQ
jgi:membrane protein implicated in regulation of membrane protease activity